MKALKKLFGPVAALVALLVFAFTRGHDDKDGVKTATDAAIEAEAEAIEAKADLKKEKIEHEKEQALADAAALSDDDIIADAVEGYRRSRRAGVESADADG